MATTKKSEGLGDTIEKITEATGVKKAVKWAFGKDCGCDKRKEILNNLFPYNDKPECLVSKEYKYLDGFFAQYKSRVSADQQRQLLEIHNRIFKKQLAFSSCGSCVGSMVNKLRKVYNEYKKEDANTKT